MLRKIDSLPTLIDYLCQHSISRQLVAYIAIFIAVVIRGDGIMANRNTVAIQNITSESELEELEEPPPTNRTNGCQISATEFMINFYIQTSICFVGFVLNMINVAVFLQPKFSGAAYAYMTAMSLADAITLLNNLPSGLLSATFISP
ncbi:hypothetical protein EG68_00035 [Paragonimus skrjabini miyazakii]|uniref:G-protein coupled receptors family 1 profile domain-containing protein n=1 Tax=Paragonimus skrjabini miyazakii TaxID=59628 RepID=A0A8S9ZAY7_9TREM|nr:hypothetical protein EG68_00035 [Paragonimus skrjabini miyazakii]